MREAGVDEAMATSTGQPGIEEMAVRVVKKITLIYAPDTPS